MLGPSPLSPSPETSNDGREKRGISIASRSNPSSMPPEIELTNPGRERWTRTTFYNLRTEPEFQHLNQSVESSVTRSREGPTMSFLNSHSTNPFLLYWFIQGIDSPFLCLILLAQVFSTMKAAELQTRLRKRARPPGGLSGTGKGGN